MVFIFYYIRYHMVFYGLMHFPQLCLYWCKISRKQFVNVKKILTFEWVRRPLFQQHINVTLLLEPCKTANILRRYGREDPWLEAGPRSGSEHQFLKLAKPKPQYPIWCFLICVGNVNEYLANVICHVCRVSKWRGVFRPQPTNTMPMKWDKKLTDYIDI